MLFHFGTERLGTSPHWPPSEKSYWLDQPPHYECSKGQQRNPASAQPCPASCWRRRCSRLQTPLTGMLEGCLTPPNTLVHLCKSHQDQLAHYPTCGRPRRCWTWTWCQTAVPPPGAHRPWCTAASVAVLRSCHHQTCHTQPPSPLQSSPVPGMTHTACQKSIQTKLICFQKFLFSKPQPSGTLLSVSFSQGSKATAPTFASLGDVQLHFIIGTYKPSLTTCRRGKQTQLARQEAPILEREGQSKCTRISVKIEAEGNVETSYHLVRYPERQRVRLALGQNRSAWVLSSALCPASWDGSVNIQQTTILTYFSGLPSQLLRDSRRQKWVPSLPWGRA